MAIDKYDPYVELASLIVIHNIDDYISTYRRFMKKRRDSDLYVLKELHRWFYSNRFKLYCNIHPDRIMAHIRKELNLDENPDYRKLQRLVIPYRKPKKRNRKPAGDNTPDEG